MLLIIFQIRNQERLCIYTALLKSFYFCGVIVCLLEKLGKNYCLWKELSQNANGVDYLIYVSASREQYQLLEFFLFRKILS